MATLEGETSGGGLKIKAWVCVVPGNIHAHPKEGLQKFQGGGGFQKPYFLKESMTLKCNFRRGGGSN